VERLGVVTAAVTFFRSIGGTVGIAVLGGVVNNRFSSEYAARLPAQLKDSPQVGALLASLSPQALISPDTITAIQQRLQAMGMPAAQVAAILQAIQAPIRPSLSVAITGAFLIGAIVVAVSIFATAVIPEIPLRKAHAGPALEGAEFALGIDDREDARATQPVLAAAPAAAAAAPARGAANGVRLDDLGVPIARPQAATAAGGMSELTWAAVGLALAALAREAQSADADPRLLATLSGAVDGRYPHAWSAEQRARAVAREMVEPLAGALLGAYVGGAGPRAASGPASNPVPTVPLAAAPPARQPMKRVRVTRRLLVDGQVVEEQAAEDSVPRDLDTEEAAAQLRARLEPAPATRPLTPAGEPWRPLR
jgi:hypothetical protein